MNGEIRAGGAGSPDARRLLIQVLPHLTPGRCGVSDQAVLLAQGLKERHGIDSAFVVLNSTEPSGVPYPVLYAAPSQLLESCLKLTGGEPGAILVHVSGYGYSKDGAPTALARALAAVRESGQMQISVYFHELFAGGPPWKSSFWYSGRQRRALKGILAQAGLVVTNIGQNVEWIKRKSPHNGRVPIHLMPVISPAGETDDPVPYAQRNAAMVVFGQGGTRMYAYRHLAATSNLLSSLGVREILDIGPECDHPSQVDGVPVQRVGMLAAGELPGVFSQNQFGFVTHEWSYLARSSVLAAYCAQGAIPVMTRPFPKPSDGLLEGVHVVTPRTVETARQAGWQTCSHAAWNWYNGHRLGAHVDLYAKWMGEAR